MYPKSILICGGGTAGWMAANLMQHAWPECDISLVESDNIGIIGVGEGSTPYLKQFFAKLGIKESEWMPKCNATYKVGIQFDNWSEKPGYESYFHPFFSELDIKPADPFFENAKLQKLGIEAHAHPDNYFVTAEMARQGKAPISQKYSHIDIDYGYHFDSGLLGEFLKRRAIANGLNHIIDDIESVELADNGDIAAIRCTNSGSLDAELYVDCTGFNSLLLQQALNVPFKYYSENLYNDAAVAIPTEYLPEQSIPVVTKSTALSHGWAWQIPLTNRFGNGYVYSSKYISAEQAEQELKDHLGIDRGSDVMVKHLKMKVGRVEQHWHRNCLAVGLSQGFIEPLEATALMLVQYTIERFIGCYEDSNQLEYNQEINRMMEGVRDYIVTHYVTNSRDDSEYWRDCRKAQQSANLDQLLKSWNTDDNFEQTLSSLDSSLVYLRPSWYVLLMGVGYFDTNLGETADISVLTNTQPHDVTKSKQHCEQLVADVFISHHERLSRLEKAGLA
jgi:2-polyprenyl-6-methoxyphenol hydroxylase-like FAD-dependent oxidoreductase